MASFNDPDSDMYVTKRNQQREIMSFDKILKRIKKVGQEANIKINYTSLAMKVIDQLYDGIATTKIDELTAEQCASLSSTHPDYNVLAGRITVSNHHKNTKASFYQVMKELYNYKDQHGNSYPLISQTLYKTMCAYGKEKVDALCVYDRDYLIDFFGFKTLERAYMMRINKKIVERPQHMWLRVSMGIHDRDWDRVVETYTYMSQKYFTHATPTLFNAGTPHPQLSSCYLMAMEEDSIDGIFNTLKDCALISKWAGGIGLHIHNVRASGSQIRGTNGTSNGIVPMLKVFNNTAKYVDQCVTPDTWIYTSDGPVRIENVVAHKTAILNGHGKREVVDNVLEHAYDGTMLHIESEHSIDALQVTQEHPLYVLSHTHAAEAKRNGPVVCDFVDAKDVEIGDYMVYTIPSFTEDVASIGLDDCYVYGVLLGNGSFSNKNQDGSLHLTKPAVRGACEAYLREKCVSYRIDTDVLYWQKTIALPFRYSDVYGINKQKRIAPMWLHLSLSKTEKIIDGFLDATLSDANVFQHESREVIEGIRYLLLRMGILLKKSAEGFLNPLDAAHEDFTRDDKLFSRVQSVTESSYAGTLYDLQMTEVHDYMIHNGIVHNGGGKRNGSFAIYLEPWHADIELFLQMRKNHGDEELKARDLFYALWVPDLFMERVKTGGTWTLMCPAECPGLSDVIGDDFVRLYEQYERDGKGRTTVSARDLWFQILDAQMETGTPYLLFKDAANRKSNQKNIGVIKSSNLCVGPGTFVLTDEGQVPIMALWAGNYPKYQQETRKTVNVWNGREFSEVEVHKTGEDVRFVQVHTTDGAILACTLYHKFWIRDGLGKSQLKEARELERGDLLERCSFPVIDGEESFEGDEKKAAHRGCETGKTNLTMKADRKQPLFVPVNYTMRDKMQWLTALIDPFVAREMEEQSGLIAVPSVSLEFLEDLKYMLQTCGVNTVVLRYPEPDPHDGCLGEWIINMTQIRFLYETSEHFRFHTFSRNFMPLTEGEKMSNDMCPNVRVEQVIESPLVDDSYCFNEPKAHAGVFNGMRTSQCTEILEYSDSDETAVCNLASIALPAFVDRVKKTFDYEELHKITRVVTRNLNKVIDINYYPTPKTERSNMRHRPIGLGVQGLADTFFMMGLSFSCDAAKRLNKEIFETIYHAALEESCLMAQEQGAYETFPGSPASQGILQFDMWNAHPGNDRYDWDALKARIQTHGLRNSLLMAPMPTASTSQILGYNECIEPITSNIYSRRTLAGEFILVNKYLMQEMLEQEGWTETFKNHMIANNGSVQTLEYLPADLRERYRTVWEIPMKDLIDMAADRGAFICQSQSLNLWLEDPNYNTMTSMHFYSWNKGLKTGIYYLRRRPRHHAQQFTLEPEKRQVPKEEEIGCEMCSA